MINIQDIKEDVFSENNEDFGCENEPEYFVFDNELKIGDIFYAGIQQKIKPSRFFDIDVLIEYMHENAHCEYHEYADDYLFDLSKDVENELGNKISDLLDAHLPKPSFYNVVDTVKYRIVKIDGDDVFVELVEAVDNENK